MNTLKRISKQVLDNMAEIYTLAVIVIAIPAVVAVMTTVVWGVLLSFVLQAIIGILYIRGSNN